MFFGIPWFLRFGISLDFLHLRLSFNVHGKPVEQANAEVNISDSDKRSIRATLASSSTGSLAPTTSPLQPSAHPSSPTLLQEQTNEEIHVFGTHFGTPTLTQPTPTSSNANFGIDLGTLPQPTLQPSVQPQSRSQVHPSSLLGSRLQEPSHFTVAESANHFGTDFGTPFQPNSTARQTRPTFTKEDEANQRHVPEAFHDFLDVFRKSSADKLPEHRHYDHKITLQPGTTPTFGPIYSLTNGEHTALRSYIDEMLDKGFIRPSSSPAGSPVLFVPKSDGSLRLCVDYRALNNITVKDRYAIPKIDDLLDFITGSRIFSKIDLRGAYNLLRIAH
ncbi:hypothetical protein CF326_g10099, partial [Tilletia indica]